MGTTRDDLHRIAAHVLGRRRFEVSGHFGLRASPGGVATPAFGPEPEVAARRRWRPRPRGGDSGAGRWRMDGATLAELAAFAGADLAADFSAGPGTPGRGPRPTSRCGCPAPSWTTLYGWFDLGWRVLDAVTGRAPRWRRPVHGAAVAGALRRGHRTRPRRRAPG